MDKAHSDAVTNLIPNEILAHIMRWLRSAGGLARWASTCRTFAALAADPLVLRTMCSDFVDLDLIEKHGRPTTWGPIDWRLVYTALTATAKNAHFDRSKAAVGAISCFIGSCVMYWGRMLDGLPDGPGIAVISPSGFATDALRSSTRHIAYAGMFATGFTISRLDGWMRFEGVWRKGQVHYGCGVFTLSEGISRYEGQLWSGQRHGWGVLIQKDGQRYEGEWCDNKRSGFGIATFPDGGRYRGDWHDDRRHGRGSMDFANGDSYRGEWKDDMRSGTGTLTHIGGSRHEGTWAKNKKSGRGAMIYANGDRIKGQWTDDKLSGNIAFTMGNSGMCAAGRLTNGVCIVSGVFALPSGGRYKGTCVLRLAGQDSVDHERTGYGTAVFADGSKYKGQWDHNQRHGCGTMTYADGARYEGKWRDDQRHGAGTFKAADESLYEGDWHEDKQHGAGTLTMVDGSRYEGHWREGRKCGMGTQIFADGSRYEGLWYDSARCGYGVLVHADGSRIEAYWRDDAIVDVVNK